MTPQKTFNSFAFGCRVNQAEKETLDNQLSVLGYRYSAEKPDIYIINTCAVTRKAEREARQLIYQTKRKWPKTNIIVTGCAATKWIKEGTKVKGVDLIIENTNKEYISDIIKKRLLSHSSAKSNVEYQLTGRSGNILHLYDKFQNSGRLLLKIQDGCQRFCTFCIVPYLRGQPRSERIKNLELRIKNQGDKLKEVILTAINTQAFGYDTGESFIGLIKEIIKKTAVPRISFGSIHPWSINEDFFKLYRSTLKYERLVKFFHIPLQSGSDKILAYMKRNYTRGEFLEKLNILQKIHPFTFIGTDIITGFLEETDRDFEDTYNFLKDSPVSKFHVFRFSKRDRTAAWFMAKRLKEPTPAQKEKRAKALIGLGKKKYLKFLNSHIGKSFPVLLLDRNEDGFREGLLNNQIPILLKTEKPQGTIVEKVKIESLKNNILISQSD